jgi:glycolate dehydrogenase iron-sulfur subunit
MEPTTQEPAGPLGSDLPEGARFIGAPSGLAPGWAEGDHPAPEDLDACVACGLCLPHCPTYRLTGEESASPRGRIAAMRAVQDGAPVDATFAGFMDLCLVCRACEDVCPSHVPFGRMMERARAQTEPLRGGGNRFLRWGALDVVLARPALLWLAALLQPVVKPFLPRRLRSMVPSARGALRPLPRRVDPPAGVPVRGTVALLRGCVQDRWFREVNLASIRVLARNGWHVEIPRAQRCCGALAAHNGRLGSARTLARANVSAFAGADHVVVNAAGCAAHMADYGELVEGADLPIEDLMAFLDRTGIEPPEGERADPLDVAYHDPCHALRAMHVHDQPRRLLRSIPGTRIVDLPDGGRCCGAAGLYQLTEPEPADRLQRQKVESIEATGAATVASANPGCTMQIRAGLAGAGVEATVVHPIQLLDAAYAAGTRSG